MQNARYFGYLKNTSSSLVRLGKTERKLKMKKLINWIWSKKQNEQVETFVIHNRPMWDVQMRDYNRTHGLPEDQVIG
nr:MAG TPA: hypothetical protein [Caudoviricetes sp.]